MKNKSLHLAVISVFLLAIFGFESAHAQLAGIKSGFCEAIEEAALESFEELAEATEDVVECFSEFEDCRSGFLRRDPANCINEFVRCNRFGERDQSQACENFGEELSDIYNDSLREASFLSLEPRFMRWANKNERAKECLEPAHTMFLLCGGLTDE